MKLTFLGHQGLIVSSMGKTIIIDPVIEDSFGTTKNVRFHIFPNRTIALSNIPKIDAILLTTEHLQHFHPRSLRIITETQGDSLPIVYVAPLIPACATNLIESLGYSIIRGEPEEALNIGDIQFRFYAAKPEALFWDKRVSSVYIESLEEKYGIYIQSDSPTSTRFIEMVNNNELMKPAAILLTNNYQINKNGTPIGLDNLYPIKDERNSGISGLTLLNSVINQPLDQLPFVENVFLHGSGYKDSFGCIDTIWDHQMLARFANELSLQFKVFAPEPGDTFDLSNNMESVKTTWITVNGSNNKDRYRIKSTDDSYGCIPVLDPIKNLEDYQIQQIEQELNNLAKNIIMSPQGATMIGVREHMDQYLSSVRFVMQLISKDEGFQWNLNLTTAQFERKKFDQRAMHKIPFGVRMYIQDFVGLMNGDIQIWELATVSAKQWYVSSRYDSPIAFMYEYFSEQVRPELAEKGYFKSLSYSSV